MKMRKEKVIVNLLALAGLLALCSTGYAKPVSVATARRVAVNQLNKFKCSKQELIYHETEASIALTGSNEEVALYHIINFEPEGWVIVSGDDVAQPIIAFSDKGRYSPENNSPGFEAWMENVKKRINYAISKGEQSQVQAKGAWDRLNVPMEEFVTAEMLTSQSSAAAGVGPLLQTTWGQGGKGTFCGGWFCLLPTLPVVCTWYKTWDAYCPWERKAGVCGWPYNNVVFYRVAPTGCVATAMGQIMKYWSWPLVGKGTGWNDPPYQCPADCECSGFDRTDVDFSRSHYNFSAMSLNLVDMAVNKLGPDYEASALLRDIGVAVKMSYTPELSGTQNELARDAFRDHFRYHADLKTRDVNATDPNWLQWLRDDLDKGRPIYYTGKKPSDPQKGHAFVCDGYSGIDPNHFHFNWGWEGIGNGYFYLDSLTPPIFHLGGDYTAGQQAISVWPVIPAEVWVDDNYGSGTPGWGTDHFAKIQDGINRVPADGTVHVYAGTYNENITLDKDGIRIIGENGANVTIIDGGQSGSVISASFIGSETVIDGFTIRNGSGADHLGNGRNVGGGIYFRHVDFARISNCIFSSNTAVDGGAILTYWSTPHLMNCTFSNNQATGTGYYGRGGAIKIYSDSSATIENCTFTGNSAVEEGGGIFIAAASPTITNCVFSNNSAKYGGGIRSTYYSSPTLTKCRFTGNTAGDRGGGMYNENSTPTLTNCRFSSNTAVEEGGGMANFVSTPKLYNCIFNGNIVELSSPSYGGGMYNLQSSPTLTNCTFSGNQAKWGGGMYNMNTSNPRITNCIFWADTDGEIWNHYSSYYPSNPIVTYSDIQGGYSGQGNINADPVFFGAASGDLRLLSESPCIDIGDNSAVGGLENDFDGTLRIWPLGGTVDMGADEYRRMRIYVNSKASGNNNGYTWIDAFRELSDALSIASYEDEIWVAAGTYKPTKGTNRSASFRLKKYVPIYGGFPVDGDPTWEDRDWQLNETILSGNIGNTGLAGDNSYHVVYADYIDSSVVLDGFTITGGNANSSGVHQRGGGMYNRRSSLRLVNCTFSGNAAYLGGGMYNYDNANPTVTNCIFAGNSTEDGFDGPGGMWVTPGPGGPGGNGAGMYNWGESSPTVTNCIFVENSTGNGGNGGSAEMFPPAGYGGDGGCGGGMYNVNSSNPKITNCMFIGNTTGNGGNGGDYSIAFPAGPGGDGGDGGKGAGIYNQLSLSALINCTFFENSTGTGGAGGSGNGGNGNNGLSGMGGGMCDDSGYTIVANCIFRANTSDYGTQIAVINGGNLQISYSDVQFGPTGIFTWGAGFNWGAGNIDQDPLFVDEDSNDIHLQANSPCIDSGDNDSVPDDTADLDGDNNTTEPVPLDLDGRYRFFDDPCTADSGNGTPPVVDMGAYEYGSCFPIRGDFEGNDCYVDFADYAIFTPAWLTKPGDAQWNPNCDISIPADKFIDWQDLAVMAYNWLAGH